MKTLRRVILEGKLNQPGKQAKREMRNQKPKGNAPKPPPTIDAQPGEAPGSARKRAGLRRFRRTAGTTPGRRRRLHDRAVKARRERQQRARDGDPKSRALQDQLHKARVDVQAMKFRREAEAGPENSNTAYPLTANRVHIHEINIIRVKADKSRTPRLATGNGTRMKTRRELDTPLARQTVSAQRAVAAVEGPDRPNRPKDKRVRRTAQLGLRGSSTS